MSLRAPLSWFSYCLAGSLVLVGCTSNGKLSGGLSLELVLEGAKSIDEVDWQITNPTASDQLLMEGSVDTSAPGSTVSVEAYGLAPGGPYVIHLSASSTDGITTCEGSTEFDVGGGLVTELHVVLRCEAERDSGAVRVGTETNLCAQLNMVVVSSLMSSVQGSIDVSAMASDQDGDPIRYSWTTTGGSFADPAAAETTFACGAEGIQFLTIQVSDTEHCGDSHTVAVECIGDGMGMGGAGGEGGAGGAGGDTTRDGRWGTAELIEANDTSASRPQVAIGPDGIGHSVWDQSDGSRISVWTNRYTPSAGWGTPELIEMNDEGNSNSPQVAMDANGNALSVWAQRDDTRTSVWANRYTPTAGWGTPELIEMNDAGSVFVPRIAVDPSGNALSVWQESDGTRTNLWANRYTPSGGWGTAELIEFNDLGNAGSQQIAMDPDGNAFSAWAQSDGTRSSIWANRYIPNAGWGAPELIEMNDEGSAGNPQIAMDLSGNAICVWQGNDGTRTNIWANRYTPGGGWGTPELIEMNGEGDAFLPQIAVDSNGNALSVWHWQQSDRTRFRVWSNRYTPGTGWGTAERIEMNVAGNASSAQIAMDPNGNGLAVWRLSDGARNDVWSNRYTPIAGWSTAERIDASDVGNNVGAQIVRIAIDPNGNALSVWDQSDETDNSVWANRFSDIEAETP